MKRGEGCTIPPGIGQFNRNRDRRRRGRINRIDRLWATEARRRRDDVRNGTVEPVPGDEALARVRRSLGR